MLQFINELREFHRKLSIQECENPLSDKCDECSTAEITLGTCTAMADNPFEAFIGGVTAWGMFLCFAIPLASLFTRRTRHLWTGLAPIWGVILAGILQSIIPSPRPTGACLGEGGQCGMPSGHVIIAYSTIIFIFLLMQKDLSRKAWFHKGRFVVDAIQRRVLFSSVFLMFSLIQLLMPFGRVFTRYHTASQAAWGVVTGSCIASLWFVLVDRVLSQSVGKWIEVKLGDVGWRNDWVTTSNEEETAPEGILQTVYRFADEV